MDKWTNVCRSCLTTAESFSYFFYENISPETYSFCTSIEVKRDELPKSLCSCCYDLLNKFSEFKKTCIQSENKLLDYSNSLKLEDKTGVDVKTEVQDEIISNAQVTVLVNSDDKLDDDPSNADFYDEIYSQEQEGTILKGEASTKNQKWLKGAKPRRQKRPFTYTCELCSKQFVLRKRFEAHKLKHVGKSALIQCTPCNKTFATWSGLQRHNETDHSRHSFKDLTCKMCSKVCKNPFTLKIHYKTHEEPKVQICDECGRQFKTDITLKNHLETHMKNRQRFACQHCGKKYLSKKTRAKHVNRRHANRQFLCHYCNYLFADKANLIKHIMIHEGTQRLYKCDICFKALTSSASLVDHKRIHTGEKPFLCNLCPRRFTTKGVLVGHQRTHTGEKPFKCVVCEQSFAQRGSVKRHMKVHDRVCK